MSLPSTSGQGPKDPAAVMPLVAHLRELRQRLVKSVLAVLIGTVLGWLLYPHIFVWLIGPYRTGIVPLLEDRGADSAALIMSGIGGAFQFRLKISLIAGIIIACPVWLWQLWMFVIPAMHRHEKKWATLLTVSGAPLFLLGCYGGYIVLPKAVAVLMGFVPGGVQSLVEASDYLQFVTRMLLVFGIASEIPLVVVVLNRIGAVSARQLAASRPWIVLSIFVFAAVATPTTDPLTMLFMALPMTFLYGVSEVIARVTERRRKSVDWAIPDDEASVILFEHDTEDDRSMDI